MTAETDPKSQDAVPVEMYTETLARLYFRQGYVDEALRIYRHLAEQRPNDPHLQEQIGAIMQRLSATAEPSNVSSADRGAARSPDRMAQVEMARTRHVMRQLERWLHYLQRQRGEGRWRCKAMT